MKSIQKQKIIEYEERLNFEVGVINQMGYAGYFLIVADFINWAKKIRFQWALEEVQGLDQLLHIV